MSRGTRHVLAVLLAGWLVCAVIFGVACTLQGCAPGPQSVTAADQAEIGTYAAELETCLAQAKAADASLEWFDGCKAEVRRRFGYDDGGAE